MRGLAAPNGQHVDDTLCIQTVEDHAPVAYTQPPKSLRTAPVAKPRLALYGLVLAHPRPSKPTQCEPARQRLREHVRGVGSG